MFVNVLGFRGRSPVVGVEPCYMRKHLKGNGGRDRTRTCDLLRVKQAL